MTTASQLPVPADPRAFRIIFFNRFYAPDHSATAQILTDLAEHLAATGHDVTVVASRAIYGRDEGLLPARDIIAGVKVRRTATPRRRAGMVGRILAYLHYYVSAFLIAWAEATPGVVLVAKTDPPLLSVPLAIAARLRRTMLVHWVQDLYPEIAASYGLGLANGPVGIVLTAMRNWSYRRADTVVAIGELMAARIAAMGVADRQLAIISNWTNDADIAPRTDRSPALRAAWDIPENAFVLEYSGNLGRAHEYETLLAAATLLRARTDIIFLFVGGGHFLEALRDRVAALGLGNFRFAPYQPRERLSESLGAGDAHWLSLRPAFEGLIVPSKLFGICAAARPPIAVCAPDGEIARLLEPGRSCLQVTPGDGPALAAAIARLADDRAAAAAIGRSARLALEARFTKAHALNRWRDIFADLAERGAARTGTANLPDDEAQRAAMKSDVDE